MHWWIDRLIDWLIKSSIYWYSLGWFDFVSMHSGQLGAFNVFSCRCWEAWWSGWTFIVFRKLLTIFGSMTSQGLGFSKKIYCSVFFCLRSIMFTSVHTLIRCPSLIQFASRTRPECAEVSKNSGEFVHSGLSEESDARIHGQCREIFSSAEICRCFRYFSMSLYFLDFRYAFFSCVVWDDFSPRRRPSSSRSAGHCDEVWPLDDDSDRWLTDEGQRNLGTSPWADPSKLVIMYLVIDWLIDCKFHPSILEQGYMYDFLRRSPVHLLFVVWSRPAWTWAVTWRVSCCWISTNRPGPPSWPPSTWSPWTDVYVVFFFLPTSLENFFHVF